MVRSFSLLTVFLLSLLVAWDSARAQIGVTHGQALSPAAYQAVMAGEERLSAVTKAASANADSSDPEAKKKAEEAQKQAQRLQKLQQLSYDRRPATILHEWARPPEEPKTEHDGIEKDAAGEMILSEENGEPEGETDEDEKDAAGEMSLGLEEGQANGEHEADQPDTFDDDLKQLRRNVTLGAWPEVKEFLASLPEKEGEAAYKRMLQSLSSAPSGSPPGLPANLPPEVLAQFSSYIQSRGSQRDPRFLDQNHFLFEDVLALAESAPIDLEKQQVTSLGMILRLTISAGNAVESLVPLLRLEAAKPQEEAVLSKRQLALLLIASGESIAAGEFLPTVEEAKQEKDHEALNLLSRICLARYSKEDKDEFLEEAWNVTQAVFTLGDVNKEEREEALRRAVDLAPKVREELGLKWLEESFTDEPQRGMEIISTIGSVAATGVQSRPTDAAFRLKSIELQTTAVEALLKASQERAAEWSDMLNLLALNWLREANATYTYDESTSSSSRMQRDPYGNFFYLPDSYSRSMSSSGRIQAIPTAKLLEVKPSDTWLSLVSESLRPKFDTIFAQLYLKVDEEDKAFPYIEQLAQGHPDKAEDLVDEFLRVWTRNHDPNASRNRTNYYMFMYGYERKAESIPLTRSKQERNLKELAELVRRLQALPLKELDEKLLARAFTTCHSNAEVYRLEAIQSVFGSLENLDPETLAELAQQMRANLIGVWRQPAVQQQNKTKRKQQDIQAEVLRGYAVAREVLESGLEKHPGHWALELATAALDHDENNYQAELAKSSEFSKKRDHSFEGFQKAARAYAAKTPELDRDEETTRVFELWFYASLGACDLQHVSEESVPNLKQPKLIRQAILALPEEAAERHIAMFANSLFTRMSAINPAVKHRYLTGGFEIVGDHKRAREARKVFDYYKDLVTEIKLEAVVDGSDVVGHQRPFGLFVNIRHTREIERESGGFGRYLQNQNAGRSYYYNYGRPTEDYRDKFEEIVNQALGEHFEVHSVTFQTEDVSSKALADEYGWRTTPYAYLLLQARGPEVDKIPPVRLDLDFLDTSGYVIIPVETPALPIDASGERGEFRPVQNLSVTQTLDERQADEGKLILELKASGQGLVPDFDELFTFDPDLFDVVQTNDEGLAVSQFDEESDENVVVSERTWMVTMQAEQGLAELPQTFRFAEVVLPTEEILYQRYVDADLLAVEQEISLEQEYGQVSYAWVWLLAPGGGLMLAMGVVTWRRGRRSSHAVVQKRFQLPDDITPFTVIGLLKHIQSNNGLDGNGRQELQTSIGRLERFYFGQAAADEPDLNEIAESWVRRSN